VWDLLDILGAFSVPHRSLLCLSDKAASGAVAVYVATKVDD
jgi:hypothetical protein